MPCVRSLVSNSVHGEVPFTRCIAEINSQRIFFGKLFFDNTCKMRLGGLMNFLLKFKQLLEGNIQGDFLGINAILKLI
jgi:hypothetical protein